MSNQNEDFTKVENKIKKLLALATSNNPHEAEIAMRQAMSLMARHNINESDLDDNKLIEEEYFSEYTKIPQFMRYLYHGICEAFGVYSVRCNGSYGSAARITMVGRRNDVDRCMYMFTVSAKLIEDGAWDHFEALKAKGFKPSVRNRNDYRTGMALGFTTKLKKMFGLEEKKWCETNGTALIPVDTRKSDAAKHFESTSDIEVESDSDEFRNNEHTGKGYLAGKDLEFADGLNGQETKQIGAK